jgi:hypothetical protein
MKLLFFMLFIPLCILYINNDNKNRAKIVYFEKKLRYMFWLFV